MTCEPILTLDQVTISRQSTILREPIPRSREAIHDRGIHYELPADPTAALPETRPSPLRDHDDRVLTDAEIQRLEADNIRAALRRAAGKVSGSGGRGRVARDQADHTRVPDQSLGNFAPVAVV